MQRRYLLITFLFVLLGGCSRYGEGDKVFIDITEGEIDRSAYVEATVIEEKEDKVTVRVDTLHCEVSCDNLTAALPRRGEQVNYPGEKVQQWETGKAAYDKRLKEYRELIKQREEQGIYYRVEPKLLASVRAAMQENGFSEVLPVIELAEFEQQFFRDEKGEMQTREVLELFPGFLVAFKERLEQEGHYQTVRRLRTEADLATLNGHQERYYLTAVFHELEDFQNIYMNYLMPEKGSDLEAMAVHFRYLNPALADSVGRALADFYSNNCSHLPAGQDCGQYRNSFKRRAMHRLTARLKENLAQVISAKQLDTAEARVNESQSLLRFVLNISDKFPDTLLSRDEIEQLIRENAN